MEVRIRLQKAGNTASKHYNYRIVAVPRHRSRQARHLDLIGFYDSAKKPAVIQFNEEKLRNWLKKGATMSDTVRTLAKKKGFKG